jgi:hypothetical protein
VSLGGLAVRKLVRLALSEHLGDESELKCPC